MPELAEGPEVSADKAQERSVFHLRPVTVQKIAVWLASLGCALPESTKDLLEMLLKLLMWAGKHALFTVKQLKRVHAYLSTILRIN